MVVNKAEGFADSVDSVAARVIVGASVREDRFGLDRIPHGESAAKPYRTAITGLRSVGGSSQSAAIAPVRLGREAL